MLSHLVLIPPGQLNPMFSLHLMGGPLPLLYEVTQEFWLICFQKAEGSRWAFLQDAHHLYSFFFSYEMLLQRTGLAICL